MNFDLADKIIEHKSTFEKIKTLRGQIEELESKIPADVKKLLEGNPGKSTKKSGGGKTSDHLEAVFAAAKQSADKSGVFKKAAVMDKVKHVITGEYQQMTLHSVLVQLVEKKRIQKVADKKGYYKIIA